MPYPIENVKVTLDSIDLQVGLNGVVGHKVQIIDDYMPWLSRQVLTAERDDNDELGFDIVSITGKRIRLAYSTSNASNPVPPIPGNNDESIAQLYRKVIQTNFDVSGTSLDLSQAAGLFAKYRGHQVVWAKRAQLLAQIQDPDISRTKKTALLEDLLALEWEPLALSLYGGSYDVIFGEGMTCQFTNWVVGNYTDFTFNLMQREELIP